MASSDKRLAYSERLIEELNLTPLDGESGYIGYISTSKINVKQDIDSHEVELKANGSIYYLLNKDRPINFLHWLSPDDTQHSAGWRTCSLLRLSRRKW